MLRDIAGQFWRGMADSTRIPNALMTIAMNGELRWLNIKCFVLNGLLYLGTVLIYTAFTTLLFYGGRGDEAPDGDSEEADSLFWGYSYVSFLWQAMVMVVHLGMDLVYNSWVMFIYIATLVLTTFWVQDIFDCLMKEKLKLLRERGDKEKLLEMVKFEPMASKDLAGDLVARTVIITIYLLLCQFLCSVTVPWLSAVIELVTQSLLISFYCFEYKTAAAGIDTPVGLALFETQWIYQTGFGFPFTLVMYLTKSVGSSVFFVVFPLLVVISCDEEGQGLLLVRNDRKTDIKFHLFSISRQLKNYFLDGFTRMIMLQRVAPSEEASKETATPDQEDAAHDQAKPQTSDSAGKAD